ncbi:MAG: class I SAM-dependent methyltransferase [Myxococcales bacterium]|nr:class I SAM-dependent methyltransferase [Myxococcales bacterium]MCB9668306.1 class I SAM-dependent methyltransferase [Alphaproteobacteria bacterium]
MLATHESDLAYVVAGDGESLQGPSGRLRVDVGLLHAKVAAGAEHPLIRALGPVRRVLDGTLGMAQDALHIAAVTGAVVEGAEASPWVAQLVSAGLRGLEGSRWSDAAGRIRVHAMPSVELASRVEPVDAVFCAPMFETPARAAPGFPLFREVADPRPLDDATFDAFLRIGRRLVVRVEKGAPPPRPGMLAVPGKAVDYWVCGCVDGQV